MKFKLSNKGIFKIDQTALQKMEMYRQVDRKDVESGGLLLGRFIKGSKNVIVDDVTEPQRKDIQSRVRFYRCDHGHQELLNRVWKNSGGITNYLGEWHTHPERYPDYSSQDYKNWKAILERRQHPSFYLYFVIVGIKQTCVWEGHWSRVRRKVYIKKLA